MEFCFKIVYKNPLGYFVPNVQYMLYTFKCVEWPNIDMMFQKTKHWSAILQRYQSCKDELFGRMAAPDPYIVDNMYTVISHLVSMLCFLILICSNRRSNHRSWSIASNNTRKAVANNIKSSRLCQNSSHLISIARFFNPSNYKYIFR